MLPWCAYDASGIPRVFTAGSGHRPGRPTEWPGRGEPFAAWVQCRALGSGLSRRDGVPPSPLLTTGQVGWGRCSPCRVKGRCGTCRRPRGGVAEVCRAAVEAERLGSETGGARVGRTRGGQFRTSCTAPKLGGMGRSSSCSGGQWGAWCRAGSAEGVCPFTHTRVYGGDAPQLGSPSEIPFGHLQAGYSVLH